MHCMENVLENISCTHTMKEEGSTILMYLAISFAVSVCFLATRIVYFLYWKPKIFEKLLRKEGIKGSSYKLVHGDMKMMKEINEKALSKPMSLNHKIAPRVNAYFDQMVQYYGNICLTWNGTRPILIVAKAELMRMVLNDKNGHFQKPPQNPLVDLLSLGISTLEGQKWNKRRRLITPAFHHEKLLGMVPEFISSCANMIHQWKVKMAISSDGCTEIEVGSELQSLSADVIARTAFGSSYEQGKKIFDLQKEQAVLVDEALRSSYFPGLRFIPTKKNMRRYKVDEEIKNMLREMINEKNQNEESKDDLLGLMLKYKEEERNDMTIDDVIEECKLFYFSGQETTANWLTWTLIVLAMHPKWQEQARQEVLQICGDKTPNADILHHLKIVTMVMNEVLRLYPPVTNLHRYTVQNTKIGDMTIPKGVEVILPTILLHHSCELWGDDAQEFKPERFAEGVSKASTNGQLGFYTFGWGPRICLGQNFAVMEAKLALAMILQSFSFKLSPSYAHAPYSIITLQPQHGAPLIFQQI